MLEVSGVSKGMSERALVVGIVIEAEFVHAMARNEWRLGWGVMGEEMTRGGKCCLLSVQKES